MTNSSTSNIETHEIKSVTKLGLANRFISMTFDRDTGALTSLFNEASRDEYMKDASHEGNPFRIYLDTTELPPPATDPNWWSGKIEGAMGGQIVDAADCRLHAAHFRRKARSGSLHLLYLHPSLNIQFDLAANLPDDDIIADFQLTIHNLSSQRHTVMTAFPHLTGLQLGPSRDTNLGLLLAHYGIPGIPAWQDSGGFYGREVTMQWQAVYDSSMDEGFGFIVLDAEMQPKLIRRFVPSGMSALYLLPVPVEPGGAYRYPAARLIVHRGNWRVVARRYGDWFQRNFKRRKSPEWLKEIDLYGGGWIPSAEAVSKAKQHPESGGFASFRQLPDLYLNAQSDVGEWAQYNDGVRTDPSSYGPYMADGVYAPRLDLGGIAALREGVARAHKIGRRTLLYVAGNSILKDSPILKGTRLEDWLLMDQPGKMYDIGYPNGISVCPGYKPWQDHLASLARQLLAETGVDGIRLDELATFVPCFNPAHHHRSPFDSNQWLRELVKKVRASMDEVNPEAALFTESPIDYLHESCNGALHMFFSYRDIEAMRVAIPDYIGAAYHGGAVESALGGWIGTKAVARRTQWPWTFRGVPDRPKWYRIGPGPVLRWHELRAGFPDAVVNGEVALADPLAIDAPHWVGRLWKGRRYWLMTGGNLDASPLNGEITVRLPELPDEVTTAFEFDAFTLQMRPAHLQRSDGVCAVTVADSVSAILLPKPICPPLLQIDTETLKIKRGESLALNITSFSAWNENKNQVNIAASCPGLEVHPDHCDIPHRLVLSAPTDTQPGFYPLHLRGDSLPLKRWVQVV